MSPNPNPNTNPNEMSSQLKNISDAKRGKIEQALQTLEEAAKDTKDDVADLIKSRYRNAKSGIRQVLDEMGLAETVDNVKDKARNTFEDSAKAVKNAATRVDESIHDRPWVYVGACAFAGLTIGYLLGRRSD